MIIPITKEQLPFLITDTTTSLMAQDWFTERGREAEGLSYIKDCLYPIPFYRCRQMVHGGTRWSCPDMESDASWTTRRATNTHFRTKRPWYHSYRLSTVTRSTNDHGGWSRVHISHCSYLKNTLTRFPCLFSGTPTRTFCRFSGPYWAYSP